MCGFKEFKPRCELAKKFHTGKNQAQSKIAAKAHCHYIFPGIKLMPPDAGKGPGAIIEMKVLALVQMDVPQTVNVYKVEPVEVVGQQDVGCNAVVFIPL